MEHHGKIIVNQYIKPEMTSDICFVKMNSGNNYVADLSIIFLNIIFRNLVIWSTNTVAILTPIFVELSNW
jgi:hypothetical protein